DAVATVSTSEGSLMHVIGQVAAGEVDEESRRPGRGRRIGRSERPRSGPRGGGRRRRPASGAGKRTRWERPASSASRLRDVLIARDARSSVGAARTGCQTISDGAALSKPGATNSNRQTGSKARSETD